MLGLRILRHAVRMLVRNPGAVIWIGGGPILVVLAVFGVAFGVTAQTGIWHIGGPFLLLVGSCVAFLVLCRSAVVWHRFVLLDRDPDAPSAPGSGGVLADYVWAFLSVLFSGLFAGLVLAVPVLILTQNTLVVAGDRTGAGFVVLTGLIWAWFRAGLTLPAAAIGQPMGVLRSWRATGRHAGAIAVAAVVLAGSGRIVTGIVETFLGGVSGPVLSLVLVWLVFMIGVSSLTAFYGVIIQGRDIP